MGEGGGNGRGHILLSVSNTHLGTYINFASSVVRHTLKVAQTAFDIEAYGQVMISVDDIVFTCKSSLLITRFLRGKVVALLRCISRDRTDACVITHLVHPQRPRRRRMRAS